MANIIFSQFFNENCRHQHYFADNIATNLKALIKNIKVLARFVLLRVKFVLYISSQEQGSALRAQARTKNLVHEIS